MKKHLIAAAVAAAVAVPAAAQVTVYGVLDMGYSNVESATAVSPAVTTKTKTNGAEGQLSGNRIGFRGDEDLGNGLKASFVIEMSHTPSEAASGVGATNRQSFIQLSGGFGSFSVGRFNSLNKSLNDSGVFAGAGFGTGWTASVNGYHAERVSNTIQYISPAFSGLTAQIQLVDDSTDASNLAGETKTSGSFVGLNYATGPMRVAIAHKNVKDETQAPSKAFLVSSLVGSIGLTPYLRDLTSGQINDLADDLELDPAEFGSVAERKVKQNTLLATYKLGATTLALTHNDQDLTISGVAGTAERKDTVIGVSMPVGAVTFLAQIGDGEQTTAAGVKSDVEGFQLGALYSLSKRTTAYAMYGDQETQASNSALKATADGFVIGVRHSF